MIRVRGSTTDGFLEEVVCDEHLIICHSISVFSQQLFPFINNFILFYC